MRVIADGAAQGRTVEEAGLRHLQGVFLVEIEREGEPIAPVSPQTTLRAGDELIFVGAAREVLDLRLIPGIDSAERPHMLAPEEAPDFIEVVIGAASPLLGHTPRELGFRSRYQAAIVGIHRAGQPVSAKLGTVKLRLGDTLLLLADEGFRERYADRPDFLLLGSADAPAVALGRNAMIAGGVTLAVVGVAGAGLVPILHASLLGALVLVATSVLSVEAARRSIDMDVILVIAAAFGPRGLARECDRERGRRKPLAVRAARRRTRDGRAHGVHLEQRRRCADVPDRDRDRGGTRRRSASLCDRRGGGGLGVVPDADRLPDQHDGLRARRLPLQ
jgi:K+/H+ antiporter YhaU regulatory subunit KhtT